MAFDLAFDEKTKELETILRDLEVNVDAIEAAAIVSIEGLPIAARLQPGIEETILSAMTAAMLSLGERVAQEMHRGSLERIFVEGKDGYIISCSAGQNAVLTVSARKDAKIGLVFLEMGKTAEKVSEVL